MDFFKLAFLINAMAISLNVAATYTVIVNLLFNQPIYPGLIVSLVIGYGVMIKYNFLFHEIWDNWFRKNER
ncbi:MULTISPECIES: hypothetical protein [Oceanobacillus]|uniref:hypothetical protein n=1 Tax=Oceanobacillus TaxID=182709 RepID=UPI001B17B05A|nr:hypothetical protein [Oceanobacillus sp. J11TS1]GIO22303.1 hypothetical protein J11TS1_08840 [Oceanobacillus sp. J11TS1]